MSLTLCAGAVYGNDSKLVADPYRAVRNKGWDPATVVNRTYWQLLVSGTKAITGMDFYKDGGRYIYNSISMGLAGKAPITKINYYLRLLTVRQIEIYAENDENLALEAKFSAKAFEPGMEFHNLKALNDQDNLSTFFASGNMNDVKTQLQPITAAIDVRLKKSAKIKRIVIKHGAHENAGLLKDVKTQTMNNGQWQNVPCQTRKLSRREMELLFDPPAESDNFRLVGTSMPFTLKFNEKNLPEKEHLKTHPFYMHAFIRANRGDFFSMHKENFDRKSFEKFMNDYKQTHLGFDLPEWDSNIKTIYNNPYLRSLAPEYLRSYKTKDEGVEAWQKFFDFEKNLLFDDVLAHSGGISTAQYGPAFGAKTALLQTSGILFTLPVRSMLMAVRGGARQFNVPWAHYQSCIYLAHPTPEMPYQGKATSQLRREMFTSYYMGTNFHQLEAGHSVMWMYDKNHKPVISPKGKVYQELYQWNKTDKGKRGESYTPFLFLADYNHGHSGRHGWGGRYEFKTWDNIPFDDGDYMHEHFVRTVDKFLPCNVTGYTFEPPYSNNIRNSRIGDICDIFFANPPQHNGAIMKKHIEKYPVVFLLGIISFNEKLVKRLKDYVKEGGTLVVNAAQCEGLLGNPEFLGIKVIKDKMTPTILTRTYHASSCKDVKEKCRTHLMHIKFVGAKVVRKDRDTQLPLLTKYNYGKGHVLVTTPYFMLLENKKTANPLIEELLAELQREVLPVQIRGNIQFLLNKITPEHWKIILINNEGIIKPARGWATCDYRYISDVVLTAPGNIDAKEILEDSKQDITKSKNKTVISLKVKPGEIKIIDIKGLKLPGCN